jgi:large subunit ribosomal protein L3
LKLALLNPVVLKATTMSIGLVGKKCGMTRIFTEAGESIPVTLIEATPNRITQLKTVETDGYSAVQVTAGTKRAALVNKPKAGHFAKAKVEEGRGLWEFLVDAKDLGNYAVGGELKADDVFKEGQIVDVAGVTKGKGFQGTIKRWNFSMGDAIRTVTRCRIAHRAPSVSARRRAVCFPARKWPATWAMCASRR